MPTWLCECANDECREEMEIHTRDYQRWTKHGQYVVLAGHQQPDDTIIDQKGNVMIIVPAPTDD